MRAALKIRTLEVFARVEDIVDVVVGRGAVHQGNQSLQTNQWCRIPTRLQNYPSFRNKKRALAETEDII